MTKNNTWTFNVSTPKNKAKIAAWNERVLRDICLRTRPISPEEKQQIIAGLHGIYEAAKLPHNDLRIVFVRSPFEAHVVAASARAWWAGRSSQGTHDSTHDSTHASTIVSTHESTHDSTHESTYVSTHVSTHDSTHDSTAASTIASTRESTYVSTHESTHDSTHDSTYVSTHVSTHDSTHASTAASTHDSTHDSTHASTAAPFSLIDRVKTMRSIAMYITGCKPADPWDLRDSGAEWYHWHSYLAFVRDIVGWSHPSHTNFAHSETVQRLGGVRYMHRNFVVVADHPRVRNVVWINGVATLHCETGPAVEWSDGCAIYAIDGVVLPHDGIGRKIVEDPASLTISEIDAINNADARSISIRRFGWHRYVREIHADCIDYRRNDIEGTREALFLTPKDGNVLVAVCPTGRVFGMRVPPTVKDCAKAQSYLAGTRSGRVVART